MARLGSLLLLALILSSSAAYAHAAELALTPRSGVVNTNELFDVVVSVRSESPITASEARLSYNPAALEIQGIDTAGSILVSWPTQPLYSNERGIVEFSGSTDAPFSGENGRIMTIRFRAISNGSHELRIDDAVALGPGGSNVISSLASGIYRVEPTALPAAEPETADIALETLPGNESVPVPLLEKPADISLGERLIVKGLVIPDVLVHVYVKKGEDEPEEFVVPSAGDGTFTYVSDFRAEESVYRVWAIAEGKGVRSEPSETITFTIRQLGLAAAAGTAVEVLTYVVPLIALTVLLGLIIAFVMHRRRP